MSDTENTEMESKLANAMIHEDIVACLVVTVSVDGEYYDVRSAIAFAADHRPFAKSIARNVAKHVADLCMDPAIDRGGDDVPDSKLN